MSSKRKIKKLFTDSDVEVNWKVDERIINAAFSALSESGKENFTPDVSGMGRVTKIPFIRFASAALIIIAAILLINRSEKQTSTPYTIGQTIEAMRNVNTIHCFMKTFSEEQYEMWIEVDPKTGRYKNISMDSPQVMKVATPNGISCYYKNTNEVTYFKENSFLVYEIYFKPLIQDMADSAKLNSNSKINIIEGEGEKSVITATLEKAESMLEWKVDSETKLPISMSLMSKEILLPTEFNQSFSDFSYNVPLPEGIFDFKIPKGAKIKKK